jgi:hypothetical protein
MKIRPNCFWYREFISTLLFINILELSTYHGYFGIVEIRIFGFGFYLGLEWIDS